jgi:hypothetical protein
MDSQTVCDLVVGAALDDVLDGLAAQLVTRRYSHVAPHR